MHAQDTCTHTTRTANTRSACKRGVQAHTGDHPQPGAAHPEQKLPQVAAPDPM